MWKRLPHFRLCNTVACTVAVVAILFQSVWNPLHVIADHSQFDTALVSEIVDDHAHAHSHDHDHHHESENDGSHHDGGGHTSTEHTINATFRTISADTLVFYVAVPAMEIAPVTHESPSPIPDWHIPPPHFLQIAAQLSSRGPPLS
jgi:hypothetical protein